MADVSKLHLITTINNIRIAIPIILDVEGTQYNSWATLFKMHCRANLVLEHIEPQSQVSQANPSIPSLKSDDDLSLLRLNRKGLMIVRQWIYGTISNDLLNTIINPDDIAADAWGRLERLFQDNKSTRALQLDAQFTNTKLENFTGVKAYCTQLKMLADNLHNVGSPVMDERMILRLLQGLTEVCVLHVPSRYQIADIFTKGLPHVPFNDFRDSLNVRNPPVPTAGEC